MTINDMMEKKKEYGYSYEYISQLSGVPTSTVQKVLGGTTGAPRMATLEALRKAFETLDFKRSFPGRLQDPDGFNEVADISYVEEASGIYCVTKGSNALSYSGLADKTIVDYLALPDDVRVELIDGVFYDMAAPTPLHQRIGFDIAYMLQNHIEANNGKCQTFTAPLDVQIDCDDKTMVQPDVLVLCDEDKLTKSRIVGPPDFIIEVLSPSNWYHDTIRKMAKYKRAGVREYWIVMPDSLKVLVYFFEKSDLPTEYTLQDEVPVNIWGGRCKVDFRKIYEKIKKLL